MGEEIRALCQVELSSFGQTIDSRFDGNDVVVMEAVRSRRGAEEWSKDGERVSVSKVVSYDIDEIVGVKDLVDELPGL